MDVSIYYDPMIAKLISFGKTRNQAISRMIRAIGEYRISGVKTTLPFCRFVMKHEAFINATFDTHFVIKHFEPEYLNQDVDAEAEIAALVAAKIISDKKLTSKQHQEISAGNGRSGWNVKRT